MRRNVVVRNEVGVQMLNRHLHEQIFANTHFPPPDPRAVVISREHLKLHGLNPANASTVPDVGFDLPPLLGRNIDDHFHTMGAFSAEPWLSICQAFLSLSLPPKPSNWSANPGWTKYSPFGAKPVPHPDISDRILVFDVETMPKYGPYPIIAVAASPSAWYSWLSPWLLGHTEQQTHLIPLGNTSTPRAVVGHNVSYDRARILEEYSLSSTRNRFIDTMALHIAVKGMSSGQRPAWVKFNKLREEQEKANSSTVAPKKRGSAATRHGVHPFSPLEIETEPLQRWEEMTSANSLAHVARFHCGVSVDKELRNDLMTDTVQDIKTNVTKYIEYCANDVQLTHDVFKQVFPTFLQACPSPVSFAGILVMGSGFLPVDENWERYKENAEKTFRELEERVRCRLQELAESAVGLMEGGSWKEDAWLSQLDWSPKSPRRKIGATPTAVSQNGQEAGGAEPSSIKGSFLLHVPADGLPLTTPKWFHDLKTLGPFRYGIKNSTVGLLLQLSHKRNPVLYDPVMGWHTVEGKSFSPVPRKKSGSGKVTKLFSPGVAGLEAKPEHQRLYHLLIGGESSPVIERTIMRLANRILRSWYRNKCNIALSDTWSTHLDWTPKFGVRRSASKGGLDRATTRGPIWPKWYWELVNKTGDSSKLEITVRSRVAPLLLKLEWQGYPMFYSREHGWAFRVPFHAVHDLRQKPLVFTHDADEHLRQPSVDCTYSFYKLPHKDGYSFNVGNPLSKTFMQYANNGVLTSPEDTAKHALDMNAQCSYWISARDRVLNQMVVWHQESGYDLGFEGDAKRGLILPQVITMGTVTRRAIENTWLTASNAKLNRVGSELKAMIRAPDGWCIVGADVDSEELWISSVMGDAQFGLHGATAISWMTLEGTKAEKTDLHSKTATIIGTSRDAAKVFNYSRIYGAGMKHAQQLLLQNKPLMDPDIAKKLASELYLATKGKRAISSKDGRKFWHGGSESFLFNKLEEIASSGRPETPALGCGVTSALQGRYLPSDFGSDFMPSRINWVVQSSGVDYLHLLLVAMDYLISQYDIDARYLISVHDEVRFLVRENDKYRAALALQIANLWTRCQFAFRLGIGDLPQSVGFFSAVDIDHILRKEVYMTCETPSHTQSVPPGQSLGIVDILVEEQSLGSPRHMPIQVSRRQEPLYSNPHRASSMRVLKAQATNQANEVRALLQSLEQTTKRRPARSKAPVLNQVNFVR